MQIDNEQRNDQEEFDGDYYDQLLKKVDGTLEQRSMDMAQPGPDVCQNGGGMPLRNLRQKGAIIAEDLEYTRGYRICLWIPAVLPDQVLLYVSDPENLPYLNPKLESVSTTHVKNTNDIQHLTLSLTYRKRFGLCPQSKVTAKYLIKRKNSQFECITEGASLNTHHVYTFIAEDGGCRLTMMVSTSPQINSCWRRLFLRRTRDQDIQSLQRLKKILEENDLALIGTSAKDPLLHVHL